MESKILYKVIKYFDETKSPESYISNQGTLTSLKAIQ